MSWGQGPDSQLPAQLGPLIRQTVMRQRRLPRRRITNSSRHVDWVCVRPSDNREGARAGTLDHCFGIGSAPETLRHKSDQTCYRDGELGGCFETDMACRAVVGRKAVPWNGAPSDAAVL